MANWGDLKAAYRLLGQFDVTHTALSQPHWQNTRGQASVTDAAVVLFGHCLLRVSQDRVIQTADGVKGRLFSLARSMSAVANKTIVLRGRNGLPKRTVNLLVAWSPVKIFPPANGPERKLKPISGWCIRACVATDRPDGLEWIVFTTVPITAQTSVLTQVDWDALRWLIEEYHKCLKTGCAVESAAIDHCRRIRALTRISGDCRHPTVAVTQC